jgi:hypothetical protein
MAKLVRMVRLNGLEYNANRDPQAYRRATGEDFAVQVWLEGTGPAHVTLTAADGRVLQDVKGPRGRPCTLRLRFDAPGSRLVTLHVTAGADRYVQDLRLDVMAPAHH